MCTQKMRAISYIEVEKITFPPKPDRHTYRRTDISVYRVASLLKIINLHRDLLSLRKLSLSYYVVIISSLVCKSRHKRI